MIVHVGLAVEVTATPAAIDPGQSAQLPLTVRGGTPPYTYAWAPAATLDNPSAANPIATPAASTTYTVTVMDVFGSAASETLTLTVRSSGVSACIAYVVQTAPLTLRADGSCTCGPVVTYRWWSNYLFPGLPPTVESSSPISPPLTDEFGGNVDIRLEVGDGMGSTDAVIQPFTVQ